MGSCAAAHDGAFTPSVAEAVPVNVTHARSVLKKERKEGRVVLVRGRVAGSRCRSAALESCGLPRDLATPPDLHSTHTPTKNTDSSQHEPLTATNWGCTTYAWG
jgi:hypothetical protein